MSQASEASYGNATLRLEEQPLEMSSVLLRRSSKDSSTLNGARGFSWGEPEGEYIVDRIEWTHGTGPGKTVFGDRSTVRARDLKASFCTIKGERNDVTLSKDRTKVCRIVGERNEGDENVIFLSGERNTVDSVNDDEEYESGEQSQSGEDSGNDDEGEGSQDSEGDENNASSKGDVIRVPSNFIPIHLYNYLDVRKLDGSPSGTDTDANFAVAGSDSVVACKTRKELKGTQVFVAGSRNHIVVEGTDNLILVSGEGHETSESFEGHPYVGPGGFFAYEHKDAPRFKFYAELSGGDDCEDTRVYLTLGLLVAKLRQKLDEASTSERALAAEAATKYATESSRVELKKLGVEPIISVQGDLSLAELRHEDYPMTVTVDWSPRTPRSDGAVTEARPEDSTEVTDDVAEPVTASLPYRPPAVEDDSDTEFDHVSTPEGTMSVAGDQ
ncbi:hypothetical protein EHS25_003583 [Saitozyma podzolica]|uniref:Uncharacterized protein n=1 Tax=Saitozyma podzolica TaxID=1890683 RepID=A0A427Y7R3_9TREE|nr:hypothetical protein EHS25_003583 [Saitozyma podzolica]